MDSLFVSVMLLGIFSRVKVNVTFTLLWFGILIRIWYSSNYQYIVYGNEHDESKNADERRESTESPDNRGIFKKVKTKKPEQRNGLNC